MGIVSATPYPSRYADEPTIWEMEERLAEEERYWEIASVGKFSLAFEVIPPRRCTNTVLQRDLARVLGEALMEKPVYDKRKKTYSVGSWGINGEKVTSGYFDADGLPSVERVMNALDAHGYEPDVLITVFFKPEKMTGQQVCNLLTIVGSRLELITTALALTEELRVILYDRPAFGIPLNAFSFDKVEACVYLLRQASIQAMTTRKARMKPASGENPKFEMRSWLLRLGFIGDEFARPRQTLLRALDGDGAFYSADQKQKAMMSRKAKRLLG